MADKLALLKRYWGYGSFRPMQEEIVDSVVQGHDTLALLPTGGGKSLCYQMPALMREGICLVVSPLVALMKDQVQRLNDKGLKAACIVSGMGSTEVTNVLYNAIAGELKFLYVSPERLRQRRFIEHLRKMQVGLIAVDEAHCISQWGYDFRPPYLQVAEVRAYHPQTPVIALTATATPSVQEDIVRNLLMKDCHVFRSSFRRPNLAYSVLHEGDKAAAMLRTIHRIGGSGIVYVRSRRLTQMVAMQLQTDGITATSYHAGMVSTERDKRQAMWMQGACRVMVATNAFGMGIDKPDVRYVIHLDIPDSVEAYFQEAGRAGRDGLPAEAVLICDKSDLKKMEHDFEVDFPSLKYIRNVYRALCNYCKLPVGSGADTSHDFDMEDICSNYNLRVREFYSACRHLEREGLISLPERDELSSTLYIPVGRDEVYRFQVDHMAMGNLLQAIMRLYPGIFSGPTAIDEGRVAARCMMEVTDVTALLKQMHEMHVVEYCPCPSKPQIVFLQERVNENDIMLNESNYAHLKQAAQKRLEAMRHYVTSGDRCRSRQLLEYFGEDQQDDCGQCDVCQARRSDPAVMEQAVLTLLADGQRMTVNELVARMGVQQPHAVHEVVRRLLDCGELRLDENLYLAIAR